MTAAHDGQARYGVQTLDAVLPHCLLLHHFADVPVPPPSAATSPPPPVAESNPVAAFLSHRLGGIFAPASSRAPANLDA